MTNILNGYLFIGVIMIIIGFFLIYLSLCAKPREVQSKGIGIIFFGSLPIIMNGNRKWIITALVGVSLIIFIFIARNLKPDLIGW